MNITDTIDNLLGREGGYVDNPDDRGGETNWGITKAVARAYGYQGTMKDLQRETAFRIYLVRYWSEPGFDKVERVSPTVAEELLDTGVNMGPTTASKFLQRALNLLNSKGRDWPDMVVDGKIGPMTMSALQNLMTKRGSTGTTVLLRMLNSQQGARYMELAEADPRQETFVFGWFANRVQ